MVVAGRKIEIARSTVPPLTPLLVPFTEIQEILKFSGAELCYDVAYEKNRFPYPYE